MASDDEKVPAPFERWTRMVPDTKIVADVTAENIGQMAAIVGGSVDYSGDEPVLVVPGHGVHDREWRVKLGVTLSLGWKRENGKYHVHNASGWNGERADATPWERVDG